MPVNDNCSKLLSHPNEEENGDISTAEHKPPFASFVFHTIP